MSEALEIRRARRADLRAIADLHNACRPAAAALTDADVLVSLFEAGYLLALQDATLRGALAWSAENLVARVDDAYVAAGAPAETLSLLLDALEAEAGVLACEVVLLKELAPALRAAAGACGYAEAAPAEMPAPWREAAGGTPLLLKRLSEGRARRPL